MPCGEPCGKRVIFPHTRETFSYKVFLLKCIIVQVFYFWLPRVVKRGEAFWLDIRQARYSGESPKCHFVKTSKPAPRESRKREQGRDWKERRESRGPAGMQDESRKAVSATLCRPPRDAVRTDAASAPAHGGKGLQKDKGDLHADGLHLEGKSRPKPPFSPFSTLPKTSLRQEICVFAARRKFLSAKKFRFCRTKTPAKAEKCSIRTVPAPVF